ncbi:IMPACT family protein [Halonatronum saccharophilum]|uniref:IMPACT family protein n=1 Tax=Halonatronum saccharophilum TaxID=150060 RepID=UPI0004836EFE|nr:YigZ family protein [Halonatronum saccharophilum]
MLDKYKTIAKDLRIENKIKDCKFITSIKKVRSVQDAQEFIRDISDEFSDATHNVYAFKVGLGDRADKGCSDDGEPAGSSGPPSLQAIEGEGVTNLAVVVTRYYGGTKHGVGGLIRAYGGEVREVIRVAGIIEKVRYTKLSILVSYDNMGGVINDLEGNRGEIVNIEYKNEGVVITAIIKPTYLEAFKKRVVDVTRGGASFELGEDYFR